MDKRTIKNTYILPIIQSICVNYVSILLWIMQVC